jgi:hypothetical protein
MNICNLSIIDERLQHTPTYEVFLERDNNICSLNVIYALAALLEHSVHSLGNHSLGGRLIGHLLLETSVTSQLTPHFPHYGSGGRGEL